MFGLLQQEHYSADPLPILMTAEGYEGLQVKWESNTVSPERDHNEGNRMHLKNKALAVRVGTTMKRTSHRYILNLTIALFAATGRLWTAEVAQPWPTFHGSLRDLQGTGPGRCTRGALAILGRTASQSTP